MKYSMHSKEDHTQRQTEHTQSEVNDISDKEDHIDSKVVSITIRTTTTIVFLMKRNTTQAILYVIVMAVIVVW